MNLTILIILLISFFSGVSASWPIPSFLSRIPFSIFRIPYDLDIDTTSPERLLKQLASLQRPHESSLPILLRCPWNVFFRLYDLHISLLWSFP
jgi:hypothetical protein